MCTVILGLVPAALKATEVEKIAILTYHTHPPFITGARQGLTYDLAIYLSERSGGRYRFEIREMSRPAVDKALTLPRIALVPWVHPAWFHDVTESKYLWSTQGLMDDSTSFISRQAKKIIYEGPASLAHLTIGGLRGHVYDDIDTYVQHTHTIRRVDADQHLENFQKLINGRIDLALVPESAALYLLKREHLAETLFVSAKPERYVRRFLVTQQRHDIMTYIDATLADPAGRHAWDMILTRYR